MDEKKNNQDWDDEQMKTSRYGEFIPSYFYWLTQEHQREKAERLGNITDKENEKNKKK